MSKYMAESDLNDYIKKFGLLLAIIGAIYIVASTSCPLVPCQDVDASTGEAFIRMCPVQACAHGYIYGGLTLWLVGAVLWIAATYITPDNVKPLLEERKERYEERRKPIKRVVVKKPVKKKTTKRKTKKKATKKPAAKKKSTKKKASSKKTSKRKTTRKKK